MPLGIDPTVDYAFKKLFADPANEDLLINLLNSVLGSQVVDVVILNPFNEKEFEEDKLSVLDIKARSADGAWFNVEIQSKAHWSLPGRLAYYGAVLYSGQLSAGDDYGAITPAITICFLKEVLFREPTTPHLRFTLYDSGQRLELTDRLQIHTIELPKYNFAGIDLRVATGLARWAFFLTQAVSLEAEELKRLLPQREFVKATGVVEMIAQTPQERMQYEARRKAELDYRSFVNDARREGREEGLQEGREEGLQEGLEEGRKQGLVEQIQFFQEVLREAISPSAELASLELGELLRRRDELRGRLQPQN